MKPVRLRLSRAKGFNLQALSLATNGLPAVNVARPSKWGNPYYPGSGLARGFFDENMQPCEYDVSRRDVQVHWFRERAGDMLPARLQEYVAPLRGKNLACWCKCSPCHADVLLELANDKARYEENGEEHMTTATATRLSRVLRNHRYAERVTEKELAAEIGISTTMLNRLERGEGIGGDGLLQVFRWLIAPDPLAIAKV